VRDGRINLLDCYGECTDRGEILINHLHIGLMGGREGFFTHEPYRKRKLLLHRKQIRYLRDEVERKRLTLIPLQVYFKEQWVKIELGLCRGRKQYDKRAKIAEQESKRRLDVLMRGKRR
jgi:SsrA-binding protein